MKLFLILGSMINLESVMIIPVKILLRVMRLGWDAPKTYSSRLLDSAFWLLVWVCLFLLVKRAIELLRPFVFAQAYAHPVLVASQEQPQERA